MLLSQRRIRLLVAAVVALGLSLGAAASASAVPIYWIVNEHSGKALGPHQHSKSANFWIQQMTWFNGSGGAHHWKIRGSGDIRQFENRHSHMCISTVDHEEWYPPAADGSPAIQRPCWNEPYPHIKRYQSQRWRIFPFSNFWAGQPFMLRNMRNNKCLEINGWSLAENADTAVWLDCHGGNNQKWRLVYAGEAGGS